MLHHADTTNNPIYNVLYFCKMLRKPSNFLPTQLAWFGRASKQRVRSAPKQLKKCYRSSPPPNFVVSIGKLHTIGRVLSGCFFFFVICLKEGIYAFLKIFQKQLCYGNQTMFCLTTVLCMKAADRNKRMLSR